MKVTLAVEESVCYIADDIARDAINCVSIADGTVLATTVVHDFMTDRLNIRSYLVTEATQDEVRNIMQAYTTNMLHMALRKGLPEQIKSKDA